MTLARDSRAPMSERPLESRVALVTGAGGAIGAVAVRTMLGLGAARVYAVGRTEATLKELAELDDRVAPLPLDVDDPEAWSGLARATAKHGHPVDVLMTCAGINRRGRFLDTDPDDWQAIWRTNVFGTMLAVRAVLPSMLERGFGRIVAVSSVGARKGLIERAPYTATKGAIESFVRSLATEIAGSGTTVNTLAPGVFVTELTERWLTDRPDIVEMTLRQIPEARFGELPELAAAIRYLITSDYTQGTTIDVDGGWAIG